MTLLTRARDLATRAHAGRRGAVLTLAAVLAASPAAAEIVPLATSRVVDGDTISFAGRSTRVIGLDTPETRRAKCPAEKAAGKAATEALRALLRSGPINVEYAPTRDRYGRALAVVRVRGVDVAESMVEAGHARAYVCPRGRCPKREGWCG